MLLISSSRAVAQISSCWIYRTCLNVQYVGREMNTNKFMLQGSNQAPSGSAGQVDFLAGQVTFKAHLPNKGQDNSTDPLTEFVNREKQKMALTKQKMRAACRKDKLDFKIFQALY